MAAEEELALIVTAQTQDVLKGLNKVVDKLDDMDDGLKEVSKSSKETSKNTGRLGTSLAKVAGIMGSVVGAAALVGQGLRNAGIKEQGEVQFKTLLGSAEAAKQRMIELATFANNTPFSNEQVVSMSKTLQAMTSGALASGDGLKLVGDTAAALNPGELERFSLHIGRMYSQIQNGQAFGESLKELQELGAISGPVAAKLREVSAAGEINEETWKMVKTELEKNSGAMEDLAGTASGALSTLLGTWNDVLADAFRPITDALTPIMGQLTAGLEGMRPKLVAMGEALGSAISYAVSGFQFIFSLFQSGELGSAFMTSMKLGGAIFVNWFFGLLEAGYTLLNNTVFSIFRTVSSSEFWLGVLEAFAGLGGIIQGAVAVFMGGILQAGAEWYSTITAAIGTAGAMLGAAATLAGTTILSFVLMAAEKLIEVGKKLKLPGMDALSEHIQAAQKGLEGMGDTAKTVLQNPGEVYDQLKEASKDGMKNVGGVMVDVGKDMIDEALEIGGQGLGRTGNALAESFEGNLDGVNFAPADIINTDELEGEMKGLVGRHWKPPLQKMKDDTEKDAGQTGDAIQEAVNPDAVSDSLTKIGGGGNIFLAAAEAATAGGGLGGGASVSSSGGLASGAAQGSSGLGPGGAVGGSAAIGVLQSIDQKVAEIISLMSNPTQTGGGVTLDIV